MVFEVDADGCLIGFTGLSCPALGLTDEHIGSPIAHPAIAEGLRDVLNAHRRVSAIPIPSQGLTLELHPLAWRGGAVGVAHLLDGSGPHAALTDLGRWTRASVHMLNNSMLAILGYAQRGRAATDSAARTHAFEQIERSGLALRDRAQILLRHGRTRTTGDEAPTCEAEAVFDAALRLVALTLPDALNIPKPQSTALPPFDAPCSMLAHATANLIANALDAVQGDITRVQLDLAQQGQDLVLTVTDDGDGLSERMLNRVFEPYLTTRASNPDALGGDGLGLPISQRICQSLGGRLELTSAPGEGTQARIVCGAHRAPPPKASD